MKVVDVAPGIAVVDASEAGLRILCGCPENSVKFLMRAGVVHPTEQNGVRFETGPNAVLLSEAPLRNGQFRNAAEFPILHMLYKQGMIIPGHPNNDGHRPLIIGMPRCVNELAEYVYLGNYGLTEPSEIVGGGIDESAAAEMLKIKKIFSYGRFQTADELLELKRIDSPITEIRGGLFLRRLAPDQYEFIMDGETIAIDLRHREDELQLSPYVLPRREASRERFAVTHIGEGDGWDPTRPCMASLLSIGGELWLIDAGPDIVYSLDALGLELRDIAGVFNSHVHDDHFLGLAALFRGERRLRYCAVPCVRRAAARKLAALARIDEEEFGQYFEVRDLEANRWNAFDGFEVMPIPAPHPVENTLFKFRAEGPDGVKTYAHWADLTSFSILESMSEEKRGEKGITRKEIDRIRSTYLEPADLKKLDVGGGMIHGDVADFAGDRSGKLLLSHTSEPIEGTAFAQVAEFGDADVLIAGKAGGRAGTRKRTEGVRRPSAPFRFLDPVSEPETILTGAREKRFAEGERLDDDAVCFIESGNVRIKAVGKTVETVGAGGVVGLASIVDARDRMLTLEAAAPTIALCVDPAKIAAVPALLWRARELYARRLLAAEKDLDFDWKPDYDIGIPDIDRGHRRLFSEIEALCETEEGPCREICREALRAAMEDHFVEEERLMEKIGYPWVREHRRLHEKLISDFAAEIAAAGAEDRRMKMKDCFVRHTLIADRRYLPWVK